jgi:hypothetical protein
MQQTHRPRPVATATPGAVLLSLFVVLAPAACRTSEPATGSAALAQIDLADACRRPEAGVPAAFFGAVESSALERAMEQHVAVVDCPARRVLPDCRAAGAYAYVPSNGASRSMVDLREGDTSSEMTSAVLGTRTAHPEPVAATRVEGDCQGATHVVRQVDAGAFTVRLVSTGPSRPSLQAAERKSGDLRLCDAGARNSRPPPQCGSAVMLYLTPLSDAGSR